MGARTNSKRVTRGKRSFGRKLGSAVLMLSILGLAGGGGWLIYDTLTAEPVSVDAPLPASRDIVVEQAAPVGPECFALDEACPVEHADTGGGENGWNSVWAGDELTSMSVEGMAPGSVFVPAAKAYAEVRGTEGFSPSQYEDFLSIDVPDNPHRGFWYAGGAPLTAGPEGTPGRHGVTALGTHAGYDGHWGSFISIANLTGNETVWTKDWDGNIQRWQVSRVHFMWHTEFPEAYWSNEGPRTLLLTTCGGPAGEAGQYSHNVFVEAVPVELDGSRWSVAADEERLQAKQAAIEKEAANVTGSLAVLDEMVAARLAAKAAEAEEANAEVSSEGGASEGAAEEGPSSEGAVSTEATFG